MRVGPANGQPFLVLECLQAEHAAARDEYLVALSVLISVLGAYATRELVNWVRGARGRARFAWLLDGSIADGIGTWSMHYTAMLGLHLPVPVAYDRPNVLLSLLVGIVGSAAALLVLSLSRVGWLHVLAASVFMGGVGISGLHFVAMGAMRLEGRGRGDYSPALVVHSIVSAIGICCLCGVEAAEENDEQHCDCSGG